MKQDNGERLLAACLPGGEVRAVWRGASLGWEWERTPAGGLLQWRPEGKSWHGILYAVTPEGAFLPPLRLAPIREKLGLSRSRLLQAVEVSEERVWLAGGAVLAEVEAATGRVLKTTRLPHSHLEEDRGWGSDVRAAGGGFFYHTGRRLYFYRLDGGRKDLGQA